jgi:UDP-hydrolysing UDP-N-acetyl-D-glucosamine 2-epimerase
MRKIGVITGARAEYGYLRPLMEKIRESSKLHLQTFVTGMHLVNEYGYTVREILRDNFEVTDTIDMGLKADNTNYDMATSIGEGIKGFANVFKKRNPDLVVVCGDRIEALASSIAAVSLNIPIAHIGGGEIAFGEIDDSTRHCITKFAHLHFTSTKQSAERVLKLGEEKWRVFRVGALSLDTILNQELMEETKLRQKYSLQDKPIILVCYHPITTEWADAGRQMKVVMAATIEIANEEDTSIVVVFPNYYPGGYQIIHTIEKLGSDHKNIRIFESLPHFDFISLMAASSAFVGNSSSGIIEAPSLGIPYVCVGIRQDGRERAKNVIDVRCNRTEIMKGTRKALHDVDFLEIVKRRETPYGDGKAGDRIMRVINKVGINKKLIQKRMTY